MHWLLPALSPDTIPSSCPLTLTCRSNGEGSDDELGASGEKKSDTNISFYSVSIKSPKALSHSAKTPIEKKKVVGGFSSIGVLLGYRQPARQLWFPPVTGHGRPFIWKTAMLTTWATAVKTQGELRHRAASCGLLCDPTQNHM